MNQIIGILYFFLCTVSVGFGQHPLQRELNAPRPGDELVKYQVSYKDPGRSGENVLWDFSRLQMENEAYSLTYLQTRDSLIVGQEHFTKYYYQTKGDTLVLLRHENPTAKLEYQPALPLLSFPIGLGKQSYSTYTSKGFYSRTIPVEASGSIRVEADAYGKLLLPSGDTLVHVLRVKTTQLIVEKDKGYASDSLAQNHGKVQETFRWYARGYRYPVFETIIHKALPDSSMVFSTAFFFPPQDHYYLEEDDANLAVQEELKKEESSPQKDPWQGFSYNFHPNPVVSNLEIELLLPHTAEVRIQLTERGGRIVLEESRGRQAEGIVNLPLQMGHLPPGEYVLNIRLDESYMVSGIVFKR